MPDKDARTGRFIRTNIHPWTPDTWDVGYVDNRGRFRVYRPDYPRAYKLGYALRSHVVWWLHYGKPHSVGLELHHKDHDRLNDNINNLILLTQSEHSRLHRRTKYLFYICEHCGCEFKREAHRSSDGRTNRFCSQTCYHLHPRSNKHKKAISKSSKKAWRRDVNGDRRSAVISVLVAGHLRWAANRKKTK